LSYCAERTFSALGKKQPKDARCERGRLFIKLFAQLLNCNTQRQMATPRFKHYLFIYLCLGPLLSVVFVLLQFWRSSFSHRRALSMSSGVAKPATTAMLTIFYQK
jgi:hypothetical protein